MKKVIFILVLTAFAGSLWASSGKKIRSLYDVVAPVLTGAPAASAREVGQIFYDTSAGGFKGVNKNGGIDILTNVVGGGTTSTIKASVFDASEDDLVFDVDNKAPVIFRQESYDANNIHDITTGVFTALGAGQYEFSATLNVSGNYQTDDSFVISIYVNNAFTFYASQYQVIAPTQKVVLHINADLNLQANDSVRLYLSVNRAAGGTLVSGLSAWSSFKQIP